MISVKVIGILFHFVIKLSVSCLLFQQKNLNVTLLFVWIVFYYQVIEERRGRRMLHFTLKFGNFDSIFKITIPIYLLLCMHSLKTVCVVSNFQSDYFCQF